MKRFDVKLMLSGILVGLCTESLYNFRMLIVDQGTEVRVVVKDRVKSLNHLRVSIWKVLAVDVEEVTNFETAQVKKALLGAHD